MAKNRENKGLFDEPGKLIGDLVTEAQEQIKKTNTENVVSESVPTKRNVIKRETRSKRVNLLVKPSIYEAIVAKAEANGVSVNELINGYMEDVLKQ